MRLDRLVKLKSGLEDFMAGKGAVNVPLNALFMIDLADADAVALRAEELRRQQEAPTEEGRLVHDPLLACCMDSDELRESANEALALQNRVTALRVQFLTLPAEKRAAVLRPQREASAQAGTVKRLQEEHSSALEEQKEAARSLALAEQRVLTAADNGAESDLVTARAELERIRSEFATLQVKWLADQELQASFYQEASEKLAEIGKFLLHSESSPDLRKEYEKVVGIWRSLVDKTLQVVDVRYADAMPPLPGYPEKLLDRIGDTPEAREYAAAYREAESFGKSLQEKIAERLGQSVDLHYRMLLQSGEIRSRLLNQLLDRGDRSPLALSADLLPDLRREIAIVPYRWHATFYLRSLEVRRSLTQGWQGWAKTSVNLALLMAFLAIPLAIWAVTQRLKQRLGQLRLVLVRNRKTHPWARHLALAIQTILPYSTWLVMLLAVYIAQELLVHTVFSELTLILPYLRYYICYRLFRQHMKCDIMWVNQQINAAKLWDLRRRVDVAARSLGLTALAIVSLLTAIESLIRRGLTYHLATRAMLGLGVLIAMVFACQWRGVIGAGLAKLIPGKSGRTLEQLCNSKWALVLAIPASIFLALLLVLRQLRNWSFHFKVTKRLATEVFRYKLESAIDKAHATVFEAAPPAYRQFFALTGVADPEQLTTPLLPGLSEMRRILQDWAREPGACGSLAIVGHKGTGKTCLLQYLERSCPGERVVRAAVPVRMTGREQVLEFFGRLLDRPLEQFPDAQPQTAPENQPKTLLLVDDAHNLFLAAPGGFDGFDALLELIGRPGGNVFWCLAFNHYAWTYLNSVKARHQYFGSVVRLAPWPEQAIQSLILGTHARTGFLLSYDAIIRAAGSQSLSEHVTYIENRFFGLLHQQSRGNPRLAVHLWLSALRQVGDHALRVGLPEEPETAVLTTLHEDALFVFASVARHENLTLPQAVAATQLPEGVVRHALDEGVHLKLLDFGDGRVYRLSVLYQHPLINYLLAKHCLYE